MRLWFTGFRIGLRQTVGPLLLVLSVLLLLGGMLPLWATSSDETAPLVRIALVEEAPGPFSPLMASLAQDQLGDVAELILLSLGDSTEGFSAVLTLPVGFWQSVMDGTNLSPVLTLSAASPLEGLWMAPLARCAARTIEGAQREIAGLLASLSVAGLPEAEQQRIVYAADLTLLNHYLTREGRIEVVSLSATGALSLAQYLLCAAWSLAASGLLFLFWEPFSLLRRFATLSRRPSLRSAALPLALCISLVLWGSLCCLVGGVTDRGAFALLLLGFASVLLLFVSLPHRGFCAATAVGLSLLQALLGGGLFPEALLPASLSAMGRCLPLSLLRRSMGAAFFDTGETAALALPMLLLLGCCLTAAWFLQRAEGRELG